MPKSMSWSEREDWQTGQDNKAAVFYNRYDANELARMSLILAEEAESAQGKDIRDSLFIQAGAYASIAVMHKLIEDGEIDFVRELPELPDRPKAL